MRAILGALALAAFSASAPVHGQLREVLADATAVAEREQLQLAGIRVGMASVEVAPVLISSGYRREQGGSGPSWDAMVGRLASERAVRLPTTGQVPSWESFVKGVERVEVRYRTTPNGAVVSEVDYTINSDALALQRFREVLRARYGRSGWDNGYEFLYCSRGERACSRVAYPVDVQLPSVFAQVGAMQHSIMLRSGARIWAAHEASLRAEMDRRAPRVRSPTF